MRLSEVSTMTCRERCWRGGNSLQVAVLSLISFRSQGNHRINFRRATGGQIAGEQGNST